MFKKKCMILAFIIIISICSVTTFASAAYSESTPSTDQFLVTITRPDGDETTFKQSYAICGVTNQENVKVELYILNNGQYEPFYNNDGESSWYIGGSGIFIKEVTLPYEGANRIMIVAYKDSEPDNRQINKFTVTVLNESIKDAIVNGISRVTDILKGIFN